MKYLLLVLSLFATLVHAEPTKRLGFEYEYETATKAYGGTINQSVTAQPGLQWKKEEALFGFITRAELLIEENRDNGQSHYENKTGIRLRHDGTIGHDFKYFVRGLVGRAQNSENIYTYWYIEPTLKYELDNKWTLSVGERVVRTFNRDANVRTHDANKFRYGLDYDLDAKNGFEFRHVIAQDPNAGRAVMSRALIAEYVHKF